MIQWRVSCIVTWTTTGVSTKATCKTSSRIWLTSLVRLAEQLLIRCYNLPGRVDSTIWQRQAQAPVVVVAVLPHGAKFSISQQIAADGRKSHLEAVFGEH